MLFKSLLRSTACLLSVCALQAQMTPSAPVQNFRLPSFGENGYTQWVLQGGKGIYDSETQIRIEDMALRVYSGDERMALEMTMDSPAATLLTKQKRAISEEAITIVGSNFKVSGVGWSWDGESKEIEVKFDVVVEFTQGMENMLTGAPNEGVAPEVTEIHSRSLRLKTTKEAYHFTFTDSVHAVSGEMDLKSELLVAIADAPENKDQGVGVNGGKLDSIRQLIASDQVVIHQARHQLKAGHAEFMLREQTAHFRGLPQIETDGAFISGSTIDRHEGIVVVKGSASGRAQMIVSKAGGLGIMGAEALSSETIVLSEMITMLEGASDRQFLFEGSVDVLSGALSMNSETLTLFAEKTAQGDRSTTSVPTTDKASSLQAGEVKRVLAIGNVRIEEEGRLATADQVTFYPNEERAELEGQPRIVVNKGEVVVTGDRMELQPGIAMAHGRLEQRVKVVLPEMQDLGYSDLDKSAVARPDQQTEAEPRPLSIKTVVQSETLRMIEEPEHTLFRFSDTVSVSGTNLDATCERLEVTAKPVEVIGAQQGITKSGFESIDASMQVELIEAYNSVVFKQTGRVATGNKATILPLEGQVVLEGDAVVTDARGKVTGHRMTLFQGQRRAIVEGDRASGKRATMTLPEMKPKAQ